MPENSEREDVRHHDGEPREQVDVVHAAGPDVNLSGLRVFVGGPIQYAVPPGGRLVPALRDVIVRVIAVIEQAGGDVLSAHVAERFGEISDQFGPEEVTKRDYLWMTQCDAYLPILPATAPGTLMRTDGTHIELGWASALRKPILVLTDLGGTPGGSHLLRGLPAVAPASFVDIDDVLRKPEIVVEFLHSVRRTLVDGAAGHGPLLSERSAR